MTAFNYDNEGNLLSGLSKTTSLPNRDTLLFTYNAENRPISVSNNGEILEEYSYDYIGRRIRKGNTITIYDGYNAIAEYNSNSHQLKTSYTWGLDLSNSTQGAGGVGGLLSVTDYTNQTPVTSYPTYDGNGNISEYLTEVDNGSISAHYEYDAFGNVIKKTGNSEYSYQFSTKSYDKTTGLNYYNYRLYDSISGRWINRDPIQEQGGLNLYGFVGNNGVSRFDVLGKKATKKDCDDCEKYIALKENDYANIIAKIRKKGCSLKFACKDFSDRGDNTTAWTHMSNSSPNKYNPKAIDITVDIDCCKGAKLLKYPTARNVFEHELVHAYDLCMGDIEDSSCVAFICREIRAYSVVICQGLTGDPLKKCIKDYAVASAQLIKQCESSRPELDELFEQQFDKCYPNEPIL